jgi:hypothetical protein
MKAWFLLLMLTIGRGFAADRVTKMYEDQLRLVEEDVLGLARAVPAEKYSFAPSSGSFAGVRTFGEQVRHVATMIYMTAAIVLEEKSPYGPGRNDNGPDGIESKADTLKYLEGSVAYARRAMASLSKKNQLDLLNTYFGPMPRAAIAAGIAYHSFDHYGQMVVYARMNGVVPPASKPTEAAPTVPQ